MTKKVLHLLGEEASALLKMLARHIADRPGETRSSQEILLAHRYDIFVALHEGNAVMATTLATV